MSKKVAQLTKVIYHLNSKNEDHDLDLQDMAEQYEAEMELILKDTADKVNFFKARLDEASDEKRVKEVARVGEENGSAWVKAAFRWCCLGNLLGGCIIPECDRNRLAKRKGVSFVICLYHSIS